MGEILGNQPRSPTPGGWAQRHQSFGIHTYTDMVRQRGVQTWMRGWSLMMSHFCESFKEVTQSQL